MECNEDYSFAASPARETQEPGHRTAHFKRLDGWGNAGRSGRRWFRQGSMNA